MIKETIRLLQWNANTFGKKRQFEVGAYCESNAIDVLCICEGRQREVPKILRSHVVYGNELVSLYVRGDLTHRLIPDLTVRGDRCSVVTVLLGDTIIMGCYLRDGSVRNGIEEFFYMFYHEALQRNPKVLVMGDFNAKAHCVRVDQIRNTAGRWLDSYMEDHPENAVILNDGRYTYEAANRRGSVLDLVIASAGISNAVDNFEVRMEFDSDHFPTYVELHGKRLKYRQPKASYENQFEIRSMNLHKKDLGKYSHVLEQMIAAREWSNVELCDLWSQLKVCIVKALRRSGNLRRKGRCRGKMWMTDEILELIRQRNEARHRDREQYKELKRIVQREIRRSKRESFERLAESIDENFGEKRMWDLFKMSRGKERNYGTVGDRQLQAQKCADMFEGFSKAELEADPRAEILTSIMMDANDMENVAELYNREFVISELNEALGKCRSRSSPGPDGFSYDVYKSMGIKAKIVLVEVLNSWFKSGVIPKDMKDSIQIALPKRDGGFRPISMTNTLVKVYERMIHKRIYEKLDAVIPGYQYGFRKGVGASDQFSRTLEILQRNQRNDCYSVVLFLDIKKAYDRVCRHRLMKKLKDFGIEGRMLKAIYEIIMDRRCFALFEDCISLPYKPKDGIPQGGVLSPLLWNIFFVDIPECAGCRSSAAFADDLALIERHNVVEFACWNMTQRYHRIRQWAVLNRVQFNDSKVKLMIIKPYYSRVLKKFRQNFNGIKKVFFKGKNGKPEYVEEVSEYRYLGILMDNKLKLGNWVKQIEAEVRRRTAFVVRIMKTMAMRRRTGEVLYLGYVRGYINYAMHISSVHKGFKRVCKADRAAQRGIIGLLPKTSTEDLYEEMSMDPLEHIGLRRQIDACRSFIGWKPQNMRELTVSCRKPGCKRPTFLEMIVNKWDRFEFSRIQQEAESVECLDMIDRLIPMRIPKRWKFKKRRWVGRTLARFRVGVLPTRKWAYELKLDKSPYCRHCGIVVESANHLLKECHSIDYSKLRSFYGLGLHEMSMVLKSETKDRKILEDVLIDFVSDTNLFKILNVRERR